MENLSNIKWRQDLEGVRYLYVDPKPGSVNFGDHIIDYSTHRFLSKYLPQPAGIFDWRTGSYPEGEYDFMIIPGVTMLTAGTRPGLEEIDKLPWPTYCLSGAIWSQLHRPGFLIRSRLVMRTKKFKPDHSIMAKLITDPIGSRDPFTHKLLQDSGIRSIYTGCPTLTLPCEGVCDDGFILFSFGRGCVRKQKRAAEKLARKFHVIGICHESSEYEKYRAVGWGLPLVDFNGNIELYLSYFKRARMVITGRLHGVLPSLVYGKPVFYYGTRDSRTTLLDDLGVPIHSYSDLDRSVDMASNNFNKHLLDYFRANFELLLSQTIGRHMPERKGSFGDRT